MSNKRQENVKKLKRNYDKAAEVVNGGDWSQEAIDRASAAHAVWAVYKSWVDTNPPEEATHPTESYL